MIGWLPTKLIWPWVAVAVRVTGAVLASVCRRLGCQDQSGSDELAELLFFSFLVLLWTAAMPDLAPVRCSMGDKIVEEESPSLIEQPCCRHRGDRHWGRMRMEMGWVWSVDQQLRRL